LKVFSDWGGIGNVPGRGYSHSQEKGAINLKGTSPPKRNLAFVPGFEDIVTDSGQGEQAKGTGGGVRERHL